MRKKWTSSHLPSWLDTALRRWSVIFFGVLVLAVGRDVLSTIAQKGPGALSQYIGRYSYLLQLARAQPVTFWSLGGALTVLAVVGVALDIIDRLAAKEQEDRERTAYLRSVEANYQKVALVIDLDNVAPLPATVYQRMTYQNDPARPLDEASATQGTLAGVNADDILQRLETGQTRNVVILGQPGGGKTTFLRQSVSQIAVRARRDSKLYLPIFISLPRFAPFLAASAPASTSAVAGYLAQDEQALADLDSSARDRLKEYLAEAVERGEAFLFLDGWDEVDQLYRRLVRDWIQQRQIKVRGAIVVSSRFTDYERGDFPGFAEWVARSMNHDERAALAVNLLPALMDWLRNAAPERAPAGLAPKPQVFVKLIEEHPQRALWGGNPLLFSLAAFVYVQNAADKTPELPRSRVTLYGQSVTALLAKRVRFRDIHEAPDAQAAGIVWKMLRVNAEFALWLSLNSMRDSQMDQQSEDEHGTGVTLSTAGQSFNDQILAAALEQIREELRLPYDPAVMATWVRNSGTLRPESRGTFQYRHHTFQEYLTALALAQRLASLSEELKPGAWEVVHAKRFEPAWTESMRMLAGTLVAESQQGWAQGRRMAADWFAELRALAATAHDQTTDVPDEANKALELAVASLFDVPNVAGLDAEIGAADLLTVWAEMLLQAAREGRAPTRENLQRLAPGVGMLPSTMQVSAVKRLNGALLEDTQPTLQVTAARTVENFGDLADIEQLVRLLHNSRDASVRWAAACALARVECADPERLEHPGYAVLREGLTGGDGALARIIAKGLIGASDAAYPLMLLAVAPGRDAEVRRLGTLALGGIGPGARDALQALLRDPDPVVKITAAEMAGRLPEDDATLHAVLADMAHQGVDPAVIGGVFHNLLPDVLRQKGFTGRWHDNTAVIAPPACDIPSGEFTIGSEKQEDPQSYDEERPRHVEALNIFCVGTYPVTVAEYACFVRAGHREPEDWARQKEHPQHPVVNVSWHDAGDYAVWLAALTGKSWRLPTEVEWEAAARGTDGRIYPWGTSWDASRANTTDGGPRETTPIGMYTDRDDASPYHIHDMSGNVWEWTSTIGQAYHDDASDGRELPDNTDWRVIRGGSWNDPPREARAACRMQCDPVRFSAFIGFRLASSMPSGIQ